MSELRAFLHRVVEEAIACGDLATETDGRQLAFELHAIAAASNLEYQLLRDRSVFDRARRAIEAKLSPSAQ